jgi:hypothetical protein
LYGIVTALKNDVFWMMKLGTKALSKKSEFAKYKFSV